MGLNCETCGTPLKDRKNRFCRRHAKEVLAKLESAGYLEPLVISTVNGPNQKLSSQRFLTLQDEPVPTKTSV